MKSEIVNTVQVGREILEVLTEYGTDIGLLLVEIDFAGDKAFEFITKIKEENEYADLDVIVLTAIAGEQKMVLYKKRLGLVSDFMLKMDFDRITSGCLRLLQNRLDSGE